MQRDAKSATQKVPFAETQLAFHCSMAHAQTRVYGSFNCHFFSVLTWLFSWFNFKQSQTMAYHGLEKQCFRPAPGHWAKSSVFHGSAAWLVSDRPFLSSPPSTGRLEHWSDAVGKNHVSVVSVGPPKIWPFQITFMGKYGEKDFYDLLSTMRCWGSPVFTHL